MCPYEELLNALGDPLEEYNPKLAALDTWGNACILVARPSETDK